MTKAHLLLPWTEWAEGKFATETMGREPEYSEGE